MKLQSEVRVRLRTLVVLALAAACVVASAGPAMAGATGQDCLGPGCEQQIGCGQPAQPPLSPGSFVRAVALPADAPAGVSIERTEALAFRPPVARSARASVAPLAPRAPPAA
jgi:hypothetical protein